MFSGPVSLCRFRLSRESLLEDLEEENLISGIDPCCYRQMREAVARYVGLESPDFASADEVERFEARVAKGIYKGTESGCPFAFEDCAVVVSAYCEGSDAELGSVRLTWPFDKDAFWTAVEERDRAGIAEWNDTHGCETCVAHWGEGYEIGLAPVWEDCPQCGGDGIVL